MQKRLPKSRRVPEAIAPLALTERSLLVVRALARYRFLSTSTMVKLADGNEDVTHRHLQSLYHRGIVSRLTIPRLGNRGEFIYFLENAAALRDLAPRLGIEIDWEWVRTNRERYSVDSLSSTDGVGRFMFLRHELMISDFHASLEVACRDSVGRSELARFEARTEPLGQREDFISAHPPLSPRCSPHTAVPECSRRTAARELFL